LNISPQSEMKEGPCIGRPAAGVPISWNAWPTDQLSQYAETIPKLNGEALNPARASERLALTLGAF
jgi:hypothetical protein